MPKGLKIPVGVDVHGGAAMLDGDQMNTQDIKTALSDCDNENAFQQEVGLGSGMIFDVDDNTIRARIMRKVEAIFSKFEREIRFRLLRHTIEWTSGDGELNLEFQYLDIESDETNTFAKTFATTR